MSVVITGASGVVGAAIAGHLLAEGRSLRGLSRSTSSDDRLRELGVEPIRGDVTDPDSLRAAFDGADVVFHVAGLNTMCPDDPAALERVLGHPRAQAAGSKPRKLRLNPGTD